MKRIITLFGVGIFYCFTISAQNKKENVRKYKIEKTDLEWQHILTPSQYNILRASGTERPFSHPFNNNKKSGIYICAACNAKLYESKYKYDSGSGWPSFDRAIKKNVELNVDYKIGYARIDLKCNTCGGHLGHSFKDGPKETTGIRHCINGAALKFIPSKKSIQ